MMADLIRSAKPLRRAKYVCMEGADKLVGSFMREDTKILRLTVI